MDVIAYTVSAFTRDGMGGNRAGVVLDADKLSEEQMLHIAKLLGYSETAFVSSSEIATHKVRFFTPTEEVDLCGHATIATWATLHQHGLEPRMYYQETLAGKLGVAIEQDGSVLMQQTQPQFLEKVTIQEISDVLHISNEDFNSELEPQIVSTGLKDLLVAVKNKDVLSKIRPDFQKMTELCEKYDITGLHVFALAKDVSRVAVARNFAPRVGIDEESATGTSNGALLSYLRQKNRLVGDGDFSIEQGESMHSPSLIIGKFIDGRIWVGGNAQLLKVNTISNRS